MKNLVTLFLALPCLAEPDSYSPFLGRLLWSVEPQAVPSTRLYQQTHPLQNTLYGVPIIPLIQALAGNRLSTPAAAISYEAEKQVTPTLDNTLYLTGIESQSVEAPHIPSIRTVSGLPDSLNVIEGEHGKDTITKVGDLPQRVPEMHPMRGSVYFNANDDSQIIVRGFYYPQPGPDAFFWAGEDEPSCSEQSITGRNYLLAPGKVGSKSESSR